MHLQFSYISEIRGCSIAFSLQEAADIHLTSVVSLTVVALKSFYLIVRLTLTFVLYNSLSVPPPIPADSLPSTLD